MSNRFVPDTNLSVIFVVKGPIGLTAETSQRGISAAGRCKYQLPKVVFERQWVFRHVNFLQSGRIAGWILCIVVGKCVVAVGLGRRTLTGLGEADQVGFIIGFEE